MCHVQYVNVQVHLHVQHMNMNRAMLHEYEHAHKHEMNMIMYNMKVFQVETRNRTTGVCERSVILGEEQLMRGKRAGQEQGADR